MEKFINHHFFSRNSKIPPASEPTWKRKRDKSPEKQSYYTPNPTNQQRSPPGKATTTSETPARRGRGFDSSKKLFENVGAKPSWMNNDITKQQDEAKKKDMDILLSRFKHVSEESEHDDEVAQNTKVIEDDTSPNYPGVNSLKRIKVSPPKPGQMYPNLSEIHDERPDTAMSDESAAPSEAPSLGSAIRRAASAAK